MERIHDIEGLFHLLPTGGRNAPAYSGYRPAHKLYENYLTSGIHKYVNVERASPGETVSVQVWLITPEIYPKSLWEGRQIAVHEGEREVGSLKVRRILNTILIGDALTYNPVWSAPPELKGI